MTFAAPLFLIAALAAAIPLVLHMINRQRAKQLPFSTLRFLKISAQKTRRRKRIHDVLLMALRTAVLLLIAAGLAKPTVTTLRRAVGQRRHRRGHRVGQFDEHGHDRRRSPALRDRHGRGRANPRSTRRRRPGGAAADLRPCVPRRRPTRPHAGLRSARCSANAASATSGPT